MILLFLKRFTAAYVCFGCFAGIVLIGILCAIIAPKIGNSKKTKDERKPESKIATVIECAPAPYSENPESGEPLCYVYLLEIDEKQYRTRHFTRYETGTKVAVRFYEDNDHASISDWETKKLHKSEELNL